MMVDVAKAVELGKQQAIQAFVAVTVIGSESERLVEAKSISIAKGVITISKGVRIEQKSEISKSTSSYLRGTLYTVAGLGLTVMAARKAIEEQDAADTGYAAYKATTVPSDASKLRKETKKHDNMVSVYYGLGAMALGTAIYGMFQFGNGDYSSTYYKIDTANQKAMPSFFVFSDPTGLGISLAWMR